MMEGPRLFTSSKDIIRIKKYIKDYDWYAKSYAHIKNQVDEMLERGFQVPKEKGFVFYTHCKRDGEKLIFDPYCEDNICPKCGMRYVDENFRMARNCSYHHWLSQMCILAGIVYLISKEEKYAECIRIILLDYVKYYPSYPNNDNELGTTKVFQSTYMESVWLTYLAGAYDMVKDSPLFSQTDKLRIINELFKVSASVIFDYDERDNNRQAFNNCGLCAVALVCQDEELLNYALEGPHGFAYHMSHSILEDGMWYEGDNYHFATVPSLVNIAEMCLGHGINLYEQEFAGHTLRDLFEAPLISLQPDLTFPSRKDSPYKTSISQRWYAGLYETAYRRYREENFGNILQRMYAQNREQGVSFHNAAGVMDSFQAEEAKRTRMDWRGFLNASPNLGEQSRSGMDHSVIMKGTGLGIIRQEDGSYCSLDYGHYGGEHGHPDRLQLTFFSGGKRWLTDFGTGQYYFDHLKWYRSTLAHNTVVIDGGNHEPVQGRNTIFEENEEFSILEASVENLKPGVNMSRTLVKFREGPLFDYVEMESDEEHDYDYMLHSFGELKTQEKEKNPWILPKNGAYKFLEETETYQAAGDLQVFFETEDAKLGIREAGPEHAYYYTAKSYGSPYQLTERFPLLGIRKRAASCTFAVLMEDLKKNEDCVVTEFHKLGEKKYSLCIKDRHYQLIRLEDGWSVESRRTGEQDKHFHYEKSLAFQEESHQTAAVEKRKEAVVRPEVKNSFKELYCSEWQPNLLLKEERQVIRGEAFWMGPEDLSAEGRMAVIGQELVLEVKVTDSVSCFTGGKYIWDNDSIQLYFRRKDAFHYQFLVLPVTEEGCAQILDTTKEHCQAEAIGVSGEAVRDGYYVLVSIPFAAIGGLPVSGEQIEFDLILNDRDTGVRRDKQMIWSGVYRDMRTYLKDTAHTDYCYGVIEIP